MTEYELADLDTSNRSLLVQQLSLIQTLGSHLQSLGQTGRALLFGYVMVAYFIGADLTGVQAVILTFFFVSWMAIIYSEGRMVITGAMKTFSTAQEKAEELNVDLGTQWNSFIRFARPFHSAFTIMTTLAALYFMWIVRHP